VVGEVSPAPAVGAPEVAGAGLDPPPPPPLELELDPHAAANSDSNAATSRATRRTSASFYGTTKHLIPVARTAQARPGVPPSIRIGDYQGLTRR
jgi:hypothetical protein